MLRHEAKHFNWPKNEAQASMPMLHASRAHITYANNTREVSICRLMTRQPKKTQMKVIRLNLKMCNLYGDDDLSNKSGRPKKTF